MFEVLVVIHETIVSCEDVLRLHQNREWGASYHACIERSGEITYYVEANKRAKAAANSCFVNSYGEREEYEGSVDDFAYHIALESPTDGRDKLVSKHSGYTKEQYESLAWLIGRTGVGDDRITTHGEVKLFKEIEPRSFSMDYLKECLQRVERRREIKFGMVSDYETEEYLKELDKYSEEELRRIEEVGE